MALADLLARFYDKVFIGLYMSGRRLHVGAVHLASGGDVRMQERVFAEGLGEDALLFLQELAEQTPYNYIAAFTDSGACGALPTCSLSKAKEMVPSVERSRTVCVTEEWMNYCDEEILAGLQEQYAAVEPDALYNPFALLHAFFETAMAGTHALYLLVTPAGMSLAVVKERHLRFAEQFSRDTDTSSAQLVEYITVSLEGYYGKPCCRGEFIEAVHIVDGTGMGEELAKALEAALLVESEAYTFDPALLCAQACMKEQGYAL